MAARGWDQPTPVQSGEQLLLYNSLLDQKVPFVPMSGNRQISWYSCGPTTYDVSHMGHARNYLTQDIIRRVLEDYFGFNILFVMNVTDVDDKIILKARRNHLLQQYRQVQTSPQQVKSDVGQAINSSLARKTYKVAQLKQLLEAAKLEACKGGDKARKAQDMQTAVAQEEHNLGQLQKVSDSVSSVAAAAMQQGGTAGCGMLIDAAADCLAEFLDQKHGSSITDPAIFRSHAAKYEAEFVQDMDSLGVRRPDVFTRVSEYMPEIVAYVQRILDNGYAYQRAGSVYFDTTAFREAGHTYGKLNPWAVGSAVLAAEGESNFESSDKKQATDFALWKASKPGEPSWDSPWGPGRPGWHIECSAMASAIIGQQMDIHTGGEDLRFPHHDNELAQAEAFYAGPTHANGAGPCACAQWVNYFLHMGHLSIEGLKMSKSLKNFVTIRKALETFSARQLRLMMCLQPWEKGMMYGDSAKEEMRAKEALIRNFFQNVDVLQRGGAKGQDCQQPAAAHTRWREEEVELWGQVREAQARVHASLLDNVNTRAALDALCDLIKATNIYIDRRRQPGSGPVQALLLNKAAAYVTRILAVFGLVESPADRPGLGGVEGGGGGCAPFLDAFTAFRDEVRNLAKAKAPPSDTLAACDRVRDDTMVGLGIRMEDLPDGSSIWKEDDPALLQRERAERLAAQAAAAAKKLATALDKKQKELDKFEKLSLKPSIREEYREKYRTWDPDTGYPTHDKDGVELIDKAKEKAKKDVDKQRKIREPYELKLAEDVDFLSKLKEETQQLAADLQAHNGRSNGAL